MHGWRRLCCLLVGISVGQMIRVDVMVYSRSVGLIGVLADQCLVICISV